MAVRYHGKRPFKDYGDVTRFNLSRYVVDERGCHVWQGALNKKGYAIVGTNQDGTFRAARAVFIRDIGPLDPGEYPDHTCRNRACINPCHLERVTNAENAQRGAKAKLSWNKVRAIRSQYAAGGETYRSLARKFDVSSCANRCEVLWFSPNAETRQMSLCE